MTQLFTARRSHQTALLKKITTLFEGIKQAGIHTITWNAGDFPSGVYFARLETGENSKY